MWRFLLGAFIQTFAKLQNRRFARIFRVPGQKCGLFINGNGISGDLEHSLERILVQDLLLLPRQSALPPDRCYVSIAESSRSYSSFFMHAENHSCERVRVVMIVEN